jgi:hypothetical protein
MAKREPPTEQEQPNHIANRRACSRCRILDQGSAEGPQTEERKTTCGNGEGNRNDQDDGEESCDEVGKGHLDPTQEQPQQI